MPAMPTVIPRECGVWTEADDAAMMQGHSTHTAPHYGRAFKIIRSHLFTGPPLYYFENRGGSALNFVVEFESREPREWMKLARQRPGGIRCGGDFLSGYTEDLTQVVTVGGAPYSDTGRAHAPVTKWMVEVMESPSVRPLWQRPRYNGGPWTVPASEVVKHVPAVPELLKWSADFEPAVAADPTPTEPAAAAAAAEPAVPRTSGSKAPKRAAGVKAGKAATRRANRTVRRGMAEVTASITRYTPGAYECITITLDPPNAEQTSRWVNNPTCESVRINLYALLDQHPLPCSAQRRAHLLVKLMGDLATVRTAAK